MLNDAQNLKFLIGYNYGKRGEGIGGIGRGGEGGRKGGEAGWEGGRKRGRRRGGWRGIYLHYPVSHGTYIYCSLRHALDITGLQYERGDFRTTEGISKY